MTGRTLMTLGVLILLFVAYQLWGTGIQEARSQRALGDQFEKQLETAPPLPDETVEAEPRPETEPEAAPTQVLPRYGEPVARIELPTIGITRTVVEGVTVEQLTRGPGHYPASPLPGQPGNVSIAGHRTTYGQPFHNIDKLEVGDEILTTTVQGSFVYEVAGQEIVEPDAVRVLEDQGDNRLTLIACHPKYSLKQRIIVHAILRGPAVPELAGQRDAQKQAIADSGGDDLASDATIQQSIDGAGLGGRDAATAPSVAWGFAAAGIWLASWLARVSIRRRSTDRGEHGPTRYQQLGAWLPFVVGAPLFLVALFFFFESFARFLPANY